MEVGEGEFVRGVSEDGLLDEEDVATGFLDRFAEIEDVDSLFFENFVHLSVVRNDDLVVHLSSYHLSVREEKGGEGTERTSGFGGESWN